MKKCISLADERKFKSIAFPAIGTGNLRIPANVVASCVRKIVDEYTDSHTQTHVEKIIFVIYEKDEENFKVSKNFITCHCYSLYVCNHLQILLYV